MKYKSGRKIIEVIKETTVGDLCEALGIVSIAKNNIQSIRIAYNLGGGKVAHIDIPGSYFQKITISYKEIVEICGEKEVTLKEDVSPHYLPSIDVWEQPYEEVLDSGDE